MGRIIPYIGENKKCSKPPSRFQRRICRYLGIRIHSQHWTMDNSRNQVSSAFSHSSGKGPRPTCQRCHSACSYPSGRSLRSLGGTASVNQRNWWGLNVLASSPPPNRNRASGSENQQIKHKTCSCIRYYWYWFINRHIYSYLYLSIDQSIDPSIDIKT
jgi:hypothetical protein